MLYMWAYISFFSMPLIYPYFLQGLLALLALLPVVTIMEPTLIFSRRSVLPRVYVAGAFTLISVLTVRFNTIVHPFTLADNRHYTFYVFRYLIRHPMIRFLVVPIYIICAWAVVQAYSCPAKLFFSEDPGSTYYVQSGKRKAVEDKESADTHRPIKLNRAAEGQGCDVSFVIVWLATSSLQLVTAPLVEPRYFIMPWIMWRMSVPLSCSADPEEREKKEKGLANRVWQLLWKDHDHRLWLETVWFLAINAVTGWIFLHWAFEWEQEPGKVQRFMW
ncbi:glucosyltransferase [Taxawa tesnikishii (nom. ined.)]|nr:glucosyltransferase [Dothideales sp. JES 119]